jgi:hypothetical protein
MPVSKKRAKPTRARRGRGGSAGRPARAATVGSEDGFPQSPSVPRRVTAPPPPRFRIRPTWHKVAGFTLIVLGVVVAILNDVPINERAGLLPGGHSEGYLLLGAVVAGYGTWWLGLFDRPNGERSRR